MKRLGGTITGAIANLASQGIPFVLLLVVTPILLRALGREHYGALILFNLVPQIAGQLDLGLSTAALRGFAQYSARGDDAGARRLFQEALFSLVGWGLVLGIAFHLLHAPIADALKLDSIVSDASAIYWVTAFAFPLALANNAMLVPLRALERYADIARIQVFVGSAYWAICAWWAPRGGTLTQLVALGAFTVFCTTIAFYVRGKMMPATDSPLPIEPLVDLPPLTLADNLTALGPSTSEAVPADAPPPSPWLLRPFMKLGAGAFVAQASSLATYHADKLLVAALVSPAAAGGYAICTSIANKILLVVASGATFTFPRAARLHAAGDSERVGATYAFATRTSLLIAVALAIPLIALASPFLSIWIAPEFAADYGWIFRLLTIGYAITVSSVVASNVAVAIGEVVLPAGFAMLGGAITLVGVALLAPLYGANGAAIAATVGMTQALVFNDLIARRIGGDARRASWPLVGQILVLAAPVCLVTALASRIVAGWISLFALGGLSVLLFVALWLRTFGRIEEQNLLRALLLRTRRAPHPDPNESPS